MSKDNINAPRRSDYDLIIAPASVRIVGPDADHPQAQEIVANNAPVINAFVEANRQSFALTTIEQQKTSTFTPDLDITYHNQFGQERIELTPYPTTPPPPPPPEPPAPLIVPPFHEELPPIPVDGPQRPCLMVLYAGNKVAAFDMSALNVTSLVPIYQADLPDTNVQQPILTAQYAFGMYEFIQTDADLSGQGLSISTICSTLLLDAVSLGRQVLPIFNYAGRTVYASTGTYGYFNGRLMQITTDVTGQTPCAIDGTGNYYYAPTWSGSALVSLSMPGSTIDIDIVNPVVTTTEASLALYVTITTPNYVRADHFYGSSTKADDQSSTTYPPRHGPGTEQTVYYGTYTDTEFGSTDEKITVAATVVPNNDPSLPPAHINQSLVSEWLGVSYHGHATPGAAMTVDAIKVAYDNTPYTTFTLSTGIVGLVTPTQQGLSDWSGPLYRMTWSAQSGLIMTIDEVAATANAVNTITTVTQIGTPYNGDEYTGFTYNQPSVSWSPTNYLLAIGTPVGAPDPPPGESVIYASSSSDQLVIHTTVGPASGITSDGSYAGAQVVYASILQQLEMPIQGPNGSPQTITYSGATSSSSTFMIQYPQPPEDGPPPALIETTTTSGGEPLVTGAPGIHILEQTLATSYTATLTWGSVTVNGSDPSSGTETSGGLLVYPFPPAVPYGTYYQTRTTTGGDSTYVTVTPYGSYASNGFAPWLHVSNADHVIQGYLIDGAPYIYFDGLDFMPALTKALKCNTTDIATMYMDIDLSTVQGVSKVTT